MTTREQALSALNIKPDHKVILSLDGGGMRGILTIQLLKKMEEVAGAPCHEWCDMIAGTSTGAIITGLIATGHSALQIEEYYSRMVNRVFTTRGMLASRFLNPPKFDKKNYRQLLKEVIGDVTMEQASAQTGLDILITSKDMAAGEETFFTCINNKDSYNGTYKNVLLRAVMESTMSAPTYFSPFERFIDGGTTTFNNPSGAAVLEAICFGGKGKYQADKITVFSLGTGTALQFVEPDQTGKIKGLDLSFWLGYVMDESGKDASEMQIDMLRSGLIKDLDFRRYQISYDRAALNKIPNKQLRQKNKKDPAWLSELSNKDLQNIDMADLSKFDLVRSIGEAMAEHICPPAELHIPIGQRPSNWFRKDLLSPNGNRCELVTAFGDVVQIRTNMSNPIWVDQRDTA